MDRDGLVLTKELVRCADPPEQQLGGSRQQRHTRVSGCWEHQLSSEVECWYNSMGCMNNPRSQRVCALGRRSSRSLPVFHHASSCNRLQASTEECSCWCGGPGCACGKKARTTCHKNTPR